MDDLKQRFPEDLAYDVFWDTTVFVTSTIEEVVRTLVERLRAGRDRRLPVPRQAAHDADSR